MREAIRLLWGRPTLARVVLWISALIFLAYPCVHMAVAGEPWYMGLVIWAVVIAIFKMAFWALDKVYDEVEGR